MKKNDISIDILSKLVIHMKYAKFLPEKNRRETWEEICKRNMDMFVKKYPQLKDEIERVYSNFVLPKKVLPSMRGMQFAGKPIEISPSRLFNCAYLPIDHVSAFSEAMFLLLGGTGVGISVQKHHVEKLPLVRHPLKRKRRYLIGDSIEGWADAIKMLMKAYFHGLSDPDFDFSDIRKKGSDLVTTGGKAPGPEPLATCLFNLRKILDNIEPNTQMEPIQVHDCLCLISDAILCGGIRRSALISLFSLDDEKMLTCKTGAWWEKNPQRARANNSPVLLRHRIEKEKFLELLDRIKKSGCGEPGIFFTNDYNMLCNPCNEAALRQFQFCNLTEINVSDIDSQEELNERSKAASFLGTMQAGFTNFHYLRDVWQRNTEKDSLLGISQTGIASKNYYNLDHKEAAKKCIEENKRVADLIGINYAKRLTTCKPSGTSSLVLGCSSGVHSWHSKYFIRRLRVNNDEHICVYLKSKLPNLIEPDFEKPSTGSIISIPIKAPENAILRTEEKTSDFLSRLKFVYEHWIKPGHIEGSNTHNISSTISIKEDEWEDVGEWIWENRNYYNGVTFLPFFSGQAYVQAPLEECTKEKYEELIQYVKEINLSEIVEEEDNTKISHEVACAGGACEIKYL